MHRGKIWAESKESKGSRFIFSLPKFTAEIFFIERITGELDRAVRKEVFFSAIVVQMRFEDPAKGADDAEKLARVIGCLKGWLHENPPGQNNVTIEDVRAVMLLLRSIGREETLMFAGRLRQILEEALVCEKLNQRIQVICRVAAFPEDGRTTGQLLQKLEILCPHAS
jgi:hypothetical protein